MRQKRKTRFGKIVAAAPATAESSRFPTPPTEGGALLTIGAARTGVVATSGGLVAGITPALPTAIDDSYVMIAYVYIRQNGRTVTWPSEWTSIFNSQATGGTFSAAWKAWESGDTAPEIATPNVTENAHSTIAQVIAFPNVDRSNPIDVLGTLYNAGADQQNIGPITGVTAGVSGAAVVVIGGKRDDCTSISTLGGDSLTWTELADATTTSGGDASVGCSAALGATVVANKTFTVAGGAIENSRGVVFTLNPAAAWTNPDYMLADDGNLATVVVQGASSAERGQANYDFDSALPTDAVITKVEIILESKVGAVVDPFSEAIYSLSGVDRSSWLSTATTTSLAVHTHDVTADRVWTRANLLDASFATRVRVREAGATSKTFSVDYIKVRVTYTTGGDGPPPTATYLLTVAVAGTGTVTGPGISSPSDLTQAFPEGTSVQLQATAGAGKVFDGWSGAHVSSLATYNVVMDQAKTMTATFVTAGSEESEIPGTGAVLLEDLVTNDNPIPIWVDISNAHPQNSALNPGVEYLSATPDPHTYVGGGTSTHYRRLLLSECSANGTQAKDGTLDVTFSAAMPFATSGTCSVNGTGHFRYTGKTSNTLTGCTAYSPASGNINDGDKIRLQSEHDAGVPNTSYRCHLLQQSYSNCSFYDGYVNGARNVTYLSVKLQDPTPLVDNSNNYSRTQVWQFKPAPNDERFGPILAMREKRDWLEVMHDQTGTANQIIQLDDVPKGVWLRFAFDIKWSSTNTGFIELWGDISGDEDGPLVQLSPRIGGLRTVPPGNVKACLGLGPYQLMTVPAIYQDFANIQVCEIS